ncbi:MAG: sigma-70 family RNA polymerase sigma factor [Actinomycetota bacterium]
MAPGRFGGEAALSVEARYLEPDLPDELDDAYTQTFDRLRRMFRARGCTPEEAADLAQDAAIRAFVHIRRWGVASGGLDPLLNRIARNLLIDRYRRTTPHLVPLDSAHEIHDPEQDPTEEVARRQRRRAVHSAIRELPTRHQSAIKYSLSGMTPEEVGKQLGIGRNAADALLHRARRRLREHLAPVRDGMWGVAFAFRVRFDRVMRRAGLGEGVTETARSVMVQAGAGMAAAAVVVASMGLGGAASGSAPFRPDRAPVVGVTQSSHDAAVKTGSGSSGGTNGAAVGGRGNGSGNAYTLGGSTAGGSFSHRNYDAHASVPGNPEKPLLQLNSYPDSASSYEGPGAVVLAPILDRLCAAAPGCSGS